MKKVLLAMLISLLLPQLTLAFTITSSGNSVSVPIGSSVQAEMQLYSSINDKFSVNVVDSKSWISLSSTRLDVNAGETGIIKISFSPYMDTPIGLYRIKIIAESLSTGEKENKELYVSVVKEGIIEIEKVFVTGDLKPTGRVDLSILCRSFKSTTTQDIIVNVRINSPTKEVFSFSKVIQKLDPDESATVKQFFYLKEFAEAGKYTLTAELEDWEKISTMEQTFVVQATPVIKEEVRDFLVLGTGKIIAVTNVGNKNADYVTIDETISDIDKMFYTGDTAKISGNVFTWKLIGLQPGEEKSITYVINYVPLLIVIIIFMILLWYYMFRVRIFVIKKKILQKKLIKEGSEFTVGIDIKNNTGGAIKDIVIKDFVQAVFKVHDDAHGPKPTKKATPMGTEIRWRIDSLAKGEDRILTYKIIPIFSIHDKVHLPSATIRFNKKGTLTEVMSSHATIGIVHKEEK
ncbi:MAG: hypothetical protein NT129_00915 [Candidatus Aenigmarchaeota archaeon]|nr:hypothetical protein [Candidatus Aenigmarchaeota archaeon]